MVLVRDFEPHGALYSKENGLFHYQCIAQASKLLLSDNGYVLLEVGYQQAQDVKHIFRDFKFVIQSEDYGGHIRCLVFQKGMFMVHCTH